MGRTVVELFYDVVSPYSWLGFEVRRRGDGGRPFPGRPAVLPRPGPLRVPGGRSCRCLSLGGRLKGSWSGRMASPSLPAAGGPGALPTFPPFTPARRRFYLTREGHCGVFLAWQRQGAPGQPPSAEGQRGLRVFGNCCSALGLRDSCDV